MKRFALLLPVALTLAACGQSTPSADQAACDELLSAIEAVDEATDQWAAIPDFDEEDKHVQRRVISAELDRLASQATIAANTAEDSDLVDLFEDYARYTYAYADEFRTLVYHAGEAATYHDQDTMDQALDAMTQTRVAIETTCDWQ